MDKAELRTYLEFQYYGYLAAVQARAEWNNIEPEPMTWEEFLRGSGTDPKELEEDNDVDLH